MEWQSRPLEAVYPIVYLDCIVVKIVIAGVKLPNYVGLKFPSLWIVAGHYDLPNVTPPRKLSVWLVVSRIWFQQTEGTEDEALLALERFAERWEHKYPHISRTWRQHWQNLSTLFRYPDDIRKAIYTTNAIESLNSVIRKAVKKRKLFPLVHNYNLVIIIDIVRFKHHA